MTDLEMMNKLAEGRATSKMYNLTVWAMGNGNEIVLAYSEDSHEAFLACGYWTVTIFENGLNIGLGI